MSERIRSLLQRSMTALILVIVAPVALAVNNLQIEQFSFQFLKNGSPVSNSTRIAFLRASDTISVAGSLAASWECESELFGTGPFFGVRCDPQPTFEAILEIVSCPAVGFCLLTPSNRFEVHRYTPAELRYRPDPTPVLGIQPGLNPTATNVFDIDLAAQVEFRKFVASSFAAGRVLSFRAQFVQIPDGAFTFLETTLADNVQVHQISEFVPLTGNLAFGPTPTSLTGPPGISVVGTCGVNRVDLTGAEVSWTPAPSALWGVETVALPSPFCTELSPVAAGEAFDLLAREDVVFTAVDGQMAGFDVNVSGKLDDVTGATPTNLNLFLPAGHSSHNDDPVEPNRPEPRGIAVLSLPIVSSDPKDFDRIEAAGSGRWLHSEGMPVSFRLASFFLDQHQAKGTYSDVAYLHDRNYYASFLIRDPRHLARGGPRTNDRRFSFPLPGAGGTEDFTLLPTGLHIPRVAFDEVLTAKHHFPRSGARNHPPFEIGVHHGQIQPGALPAPDVYRMGLGTDCASCDSGGSDTFYQAKPVFDDAIASDGALVSRVNNLRDPEWGPWVVMAGLVVDAGAPSEIFQLANGLTYDLANGFSNIYNPVNRRHMYERSGDSGKEAVLMIPGGIARATGATANGLVARYLLGMRQVSAGGSFLQPTHHHPLNANTSRRGNHFMAGITIGPEIYSSFADKQPIVGVGVDLDDTSMTIGFGGKSDPDFTEIGSSIGTKYVVRPGGVTGAFNFDTVPEPTVYGYDLALLRFAFRQVNNVPDEFTWMDGQLKVPGKGDFGIVFESLELECSGDVGAGLVVREQCGDLFNGQPVDNNGRFGADENCNETFSAWNARVDLLSVAFVPQDPNLPMCEAQGRDLEVGSTVEVVALNEPLGMFSKWSPAGEPLGAKISGSTDHVLDQPKDVDGNPLAAEPGFNIALHQGVGLETPNVAGAAAERNGWFAMEGQVGLPFWNALQLDVRLANKQGDPDEQAQSLLYRDGTHLSGSAASDAAKTNPELASFMKQTESSYSDATYEWGSTGFEVSLPIYYKVGRHADGVRPQFVGDTDPQFDLVVIELGAGVDFVTPKETKVVFGASADFDKLTNIDINIDLSDPENLETIDNWLCNDFPFPPSPCPNVVRGFLGPIKDKLSLMNLVSDAGLDQFIEKGINGAMQAIPGEPFQKVADGIGKVHSIPEVLASQIEDGLGSIASQITNPLTDTLDGAVLTVFNELPELYDDAAGGAIDVARLSAMRDLLAQARDKAGDVHQVLTSDIADVLGEVTDNIENLESQVNGVTGHVARVLTALNDLQTLLDSAGDLKSCSGFSALGSSSNNAILGQLSEVMQRIDDVRDVLDAIQTGNQFLSFATQLASAAGVDLGGIESAQQSIGVLVEEAIGHVNTAFGHVDGLCAAVGGQLAGVLGGVNAHLGSAITAINQVGGPGGKMVQVVNQLLDPVTGKLSALDDALQAQASKVLLVEDFLDEQVALADAALDGFPDGYPYQALSPNDIRTLVFQTSLGSFQFIYDAGGPNERSFVREMADTLRDPIDLAIAAAADVARTELQNIIAVIPSPTADELRTQIVDLIMNSPAVEAIDNEIYMAIDQVVQNLNDIGLDLFDPVAFMLQDLIAQVEGQVNAALDAATSSLKEAIPVTGARLDGYALIEGDELQRLHVSAGWTQSGDADESTTAYGAALDIISWDANGKAQNCIGSTGGGLLDASISIFGVPISIGASDAVLQELTLGFTIESLLPVGFFGMIILDGELDFEAFTLYDIGFAVGVGKYETYLGASAGAQFDGVAMSVAFLVGKTCNTDVLTKLDPQAAEWVTFPGGIFNGVYVRGSASVPIWDVGCLLRVGVGASAGAWVLVGPPFTIGGVVSGAAYGKALCIASLRGQVTVWAEKSGDNFNFGGEGFGGAGLGFDCDEATWTSIPKIRADDWCGTGDASFKASYKNGEWNLSGIKTSAID